MDDTQPAAENSPRQGVSRRALLTGSAGAAVVGVGLGAGAVALAHHSNGAQLWPTPTRADAAPVGGLHLQFGSDAATEV
ncbi:MAG TPA: hypothetical protein VFW21_15510, partial [Mycobacterium sp.]|nr:hypothetical protein [Mycobacterium sp.]